MRYLVFCTSSLFGSDVLQTLRSFKLDCDIFIQSSDLPVPSIETLQKYAAVLIDTVGNTLVEADKVGDLFASYADLGYGVVVCCYTNSSMYYPGMWTIVEFIYTVGVLAGRFEQQAYHPLQYINSYKHSGELKLGKVLVSSHPILHGVVNFSGGSYSGFVDAEASSNAIVIAQWSNGFPLIAEKHIQGKSIIVALNFCAPSSKALECLWNEKTSDAGIILRNAIVYAGDCKFAKDNLTKKMLQCCYSHVYTNMSFQYV